MCIRDSTETMEEARERRTRQIQQRQERRDALQPLVEPAASLGVGLHGRVQRARRQIAAEKAHEEEVKARVEQAAYDTENLKQQMHALRLSAARIGGHTWAGM